MKFDEILDDLNPDTYRAGDFDFEARRALFYGRCAKAFGFEGWMQKTPRSQFGEPGRDGKQARLERYGSAGSMFRDSGPVETLRYKTILLDSHIEPPITDLARDIARNEGEVRRQILEIVEGLIYGAEISPLRSADLEGMPSGGFGPRTVSDYKLDCQRSVQNLRNDIPPASMAMIERVIMGNEFIWELPSRKASRMVLMELRMALDFAAWSCGFTSRHHQGITERDLRRRWPEADEYFRQRILRPAMHDARVVR